MLSINPKQRPTIWDIINKSFIKKKIINYMYEIFSGNYPEANLPNDVDDIYADSLREQAEKLGIYRTVRYRKWWQESRIKKIWGTWGRVRIIGEIVMI